ncbi:hypothetical protein KPH14_005612 [Odynerus spinipes]|uniref:MAGE domain-containing protein n=1 Tax=Odynerus spinipes TaxID=1348599 RepID=A0AAD9VIV3_9HYME|nr:hypothetical protein KPH14_005612 [Odynerus spinipes]
MRRSRRSKRNFQVVDDSTSTSEEEHDDIYPSTSRGMRKHLSQDSGEKRMKGSSASRNVRLSGRNALSQGSVNSDLDIVIREKIKNTGPNSISKQEEIDFAGKVIPYLFVVEKRKHAIQKVNIVKHILGGSTKNFRQIIERVKSLLSQVFGYKLVDIGGGKYILVNEIKNDLPHLNFKQPVKAQQVLLFIILAHIFMCESVCKEETLWDFLRCLDIVKEDNFQHEYFGNVQRLVNTDFITQHYLEKAVIEEGENPKFEYRWGPRAEHEVSRRDCLEFVSKIYGGRPINSWTQQYKEMLQKEKSEES